MEEIKMSESAQRHFVSIDAWKAEDKAQRTSAKLAPVGKRPRCLLTDCMGLGLRCGPSVMQPNMTSQETLTKLFSEAPRRAVQIGDTMHILVGTDTNGEVDAQIKRALARGQTVTENGVTMWIDTFEIFDPTKDVPSERYIWHEDGNRVRAEKFLLTRTADGNITREPLGHVWKEL